MAKKDKPTRRTPRRNTAQLSKEVEARLSAFLNSSTEGFALLDENLNYMFINPVAERMIGVSREAVVGKNILDVVPDVRESGRYEKYVNILETGEPLHIEDMVSHTKFRDIHAGLKAFRVENWLGLVFTDITERKQAEETLRQSETMFRELFENMSGGVAVYEVINEGQDFIFKEFNTAGERIDKIERRDVIGKSVLDVFPGVKDFGLFEVFQRVWRTGNPERHPISLYKDGRIMGWRENYV